MIPITISVRYTLLFVLILLVATGLIAGCGSPDTVTPVEEAPAEPAGEEAAEPEEPDEPADEPGERVFTSEELAAYDGQDGRPAYIAVDGVVYDVTEVRQWSSGTHFGFEAGADVTEALSGSAPHGANQLNQAEIVGSVAE